MDRIEPVEDHAPGDPQGVSPEQSSGSTPLRPAGPTPLRPRAPSLRTRRPSIRLSRLPSLNSLENVNQSGLSQQDIQPLPSFERQAIRSPPPNEEDEAWQGGRRRSNSEPRPGRWSSPATETLSRVATATPGRMMPLTEESSRQSPAALSPPAIDPNETIEQDFERPDHLEAPPAVARPAGRLRRTSQAALNRFSRNRASTVSGAPPTLSSQEQQRQDEERLQEQRKNEYGSHVVDVLDVIGKRSLIWYKRCEFN